jgi:hypothetical protein
MFQICPHAAQRQYVDAFTSLLAVETSAELQNGHACGTVSGAASISPRLLMTRTRRIQRLARARLTRVLIWSVHPRHTADRALRKHHH